MLTFSGLQTRYSAYINSSAASDLTTGTAYINEAIRIILGNRDWPFLEKTDTSQVTVTGRQFYNLPYDYGKLIDVTVTIGSVLWRPREVANRKDWDKLNYATGIQANYPLYYFIYGNQCGFWPTPSSDGNQITYNYKKINKDLTIPDYTTGGVYSVSASGTAVVGTATAWNVSMNGKWIRIADSSGANGGDGYWYEVDEVTGSTTLSLVKPYQGATITTNSSGASYTIGQIPNLPEQYQLLPVYWAAAEYWRVNGNDLEKSEVFQRRFEEMLAQFEGDYGQKSDDPMIDNGIYPYEPPNPNLIIQY